jgi:hypothetical protein
VDNVSPGVGGREFNESVYVMLWKNAKPKTGGQVELIVVSRKTRIQAIQAITCM